MNIQTKRADARGILQSAGWKDSDTFAVIPSDTPSKWIRFEFNGLSDTGKTKRWLIITTYEPPVVLGTIFWFARWRCYGFAPNGDTIYERQCLRDIANFCEERTNEHKQAIKSRTVPSPAGTILPG